MKILNSFFRRIKFFFMTFNLDKSFFRLLCKFSHHEESVCHIIDILIFYSRKVYDKIQTQQ